MQWIYRLDNLYRFIYTARFYEQISGSAILQSQFGGNVASFLQIPLTHTGALRIDF